MVASDMSDIQFPKKNWLARGFIIILILSTLGVGGLVGWIYLLQSSPENSLVVLRADDTPFRVKPAAGTLADIPNQDSTFMNLIDGNTGSDGQSEVISLSEPKPEPPPVTISQTKDEKVQTTDPNKVTNQNIIQQTQPTADKTRSNSERLLGNDGLKADNESNLHFRSEDQKTIELAQTVTKPVDLTAALNTLATPAPRPKKNEGSRGQMMVQLAAFRQEDKARTAAALLNQKHSKRLQGYRLDVRLVTSTDGQLVWRVITDPLPNQYALSICDQLKRAGQDCIIRQLKAKLP